ncbi:M10 family metallopeptidase C-terminal domain-containing protein [Roseomonas sp. E05]|uniref:calcium-binding protein n=1 Tax=Roseomonas sp. E05 TaxID=3046310 RepID=UPI0024B88130|nr:M10 family metallopeptidase C-terminal domain-containing protein [Roseomonas sp. E05]MDJ0391387.1 M10 family metallopeptidase C-terminal domain-containing protein [Roseomonas sp. E05]
MATIYGTPARDILFLSMHVEGDVIYGDGFPDDVTPPGNNFIFAGQGSDTVFAGYGADVVFGGAGDDTIFGYGAAGVSPGQADALAAADGADILVGGIGNDIILAGGGADRLFGGENNDILIGGSGEDILLGGIGDDILHSGRGADIMQGGAGADTFVYAYGVFSEDGGDANGGRDVILDFTPGADHIDLTGYAVAPGALSVSTVEGGLLLSFNAVYEQGEIELVGVQQLQDGDVIFA